MTPPHIQVDPKAVGFAVWCRNCATFGWAFDASCVKSFERRHAKCEPEEKARRGGRWVS